MDYKLEKLLYKNKFSEIWLATDQNNKQYALKKIDLENYDLNRVCDEVQFLRLIEHPNIIHYHQAFTKESCVYLIMELAQGSLLDLLKSKHPDGLEEKYISVILRQVLEGLLELHKNNIIHRDIKAANILVAKDFTIKITDFGVSAKLSSVQPERTTFIGTICWMAPEILEQQKGYNETVDVWSVGITALELAFGVPPGYYQRPMKRALEIITKPPPDPKNESKVRNKKISRNFKNFVNSCLKKEPNKRSTVEKLLKHRFIKKYKKISPEVIKELFKSDPSE